VPPEAAWQRCYVHFLRNALDYVPRKVDDDCLMELRWLYDRRDLAEVGRVRRRWACAMQSNVWRSITGIMATAGSRRCWAVKVGKPITSVCYG
jgi:putative transposase